MPPPTQSRIWFNAWDAAPTKDIRYIASDRDTQPTLNRAHPKSLLPALPFPGTVSSEPWIFSCCGVKDVAELLVCKDISLDHKPILGMQLHYADGRRACVGQFRFNRPIETMRTRGAEVLYIGSQRTKKRHLYVAEITVARPSGDRDGVSWIEIRAEGKLEWWISNRQTIVRAV